MVTRETRGGFQGGLQIGGRMIMNFRYADDIMGCRVAQLVKCLVTSGYPDGPSSGGPERA